MPHILLTVLFSVEDIEKIIQNLDSKKAHGHEYLYAKNCGDTIFTPL